MLSVSEDAEKLGFFLGQNGEKDHEDTSWGDTHVHYCESNNFLVAYICQNLLSLRFKYVFILYVILSKTQYSIQNPIVQSEN